MKIGTPAEKPVPQTAVNATPNPAEAAKSAAAVPASAIPSKADASAKIAISNEATHLLEKTGGSASNSADFDAEKVSRISKQIADKTFKIDPGAIADKLIANAKEVLTKT